MSQKFLPYGRQSIDQADIEAVVEVLQGDWLTTGPAVSGFEEDFAAHCGARHAVAEMVRDGRKLRAAVDDVIAGQQAVTRDLGGTASTADAGRAVLDQLFVS